MADSIERIAGEIDEAAVAYAGHHSSGTFRRLATRLHALSPAGGGECPRCDGEGTRWNNAAMEVSECGRCRGLGKIADRVEDLCTAWGDEGERAKRDAIAKELRQLTPASPASPQQEPGACPHIVQSKEGTAYCRLAESAGASGGGELAKLHEAASVGFHVSETCGTDGKYWHVSKFRSMAELHAFGDAWRAAMIAVRDATPQPAAAQGGEWVMVPRDEQGALLSVVKESTYGGTLGKEGRAKVALQNYFDALAAAPQPQDRPYDWPDCSGDPMDCPENEGFGCCKTVATPAHGDVNDPSGQTLAGAGGDAVKPADVERALSIFYGKPWPNGYVRDVQEKARSNMYRVLRHLTATSAGTTGDAEDAAKRERAIRSAVIKGLADLVGLHEPEAVRKRLGHHWLNEMIERERVVDIVLRVKREIEEAAPHVDAARRAREVGNG